MNQELDDDVIDDASEAISRVTRMYKRKYWWADEKELRQEAWVAVLKAIPNWDPRFGDNPNSMDRYLWNAANYALRPFVWKQLSILSAPSQELSNLFQHQHPQDANVELNAKPDDTGEALDTKHWEAEVGECLGEVFGRIQNGHLAAACLIREQKPSEVAIEFGVPVAQVYRANMLVKWAIARDYSLFQLWKSREQMQVR